MLEQIFKEVLKKYTYNENKIELLWNNIAKHYNTASRYYHNFNHLNYLIDELLPVKEKIEDYDVLIFAVAYHDVIYNVLKQDNEERSAAHARKQLKGILETMQLEELGEFIIATKSHGKSIHTDINYFTDADLSILGADSDDYLLYTKQIRKEYHCYPDIVYKQGRLKVVKHFLQMEQIYKTTHFSGKYEQQARTNLMQEFEHLAGKAYMV